MGTQAEAELSYTLKDSRWHLGHCSVSGSPSSPILPLCSPWQVALVLAIESLTMRCWLPHLSFLSCSSQEGREDQGSELAVLSLLRICPEQLLASHWPELGDRSTLPAGECGKLDIANQAHCCLL
jgi:hypothetical protein